MRRQFLVTALSLALYAAAAPASAQIPPRRTLAAKSTGAVRVLVADPALAGGGVVGAGAQVGTALRVAMARLGGKRLEVISWESVLALLERSGYPVDAPLTSTAAGAIAAQLQARVFVTGTLEPTETGRFKLTAHVGAAGRDPVEVSLAQEEGQDLAAFGAAAAAAIEGALP
ncbi:MAG TPA: hypothetical protein VNK43_02235 [Gemmatimonadales bacterium]|nr:hypothetical protein [Gemmatimonadales bacterium]